MAGLLGAYFGNPNIQRQGAKARALAKQRDVNLLADPKTYAVVQGLLGTPPDQLGFSVLNPKYQEIKQVAEPAFYAGSLLQVAPATAPAVNRIAQAIGPKLEQTLLPAFEAAYNRGGLTREMVEAMGNQTTSPLTVYQGSPHKFAPTAKNLLGEFDPAKIGTGEGAQAFGYGHYSAEAKKLGEYYRDILSADLVDPAKRTLAKADGNVNNAIALAKTEADRLRGLNLTPETGSAKRDQLLARQESAIEQLNNYKKTGEFNTGYLYEIDLPDEQIAKMLDWDKKIGDQPQEVKKQLVNFVEENLADQLQQAKDLAKKYNDTFDIEDLNGRNLYQWVTEKMGGAPDKASEALKSYGIPGIRYLDDASRTNFKVQNTVKGQPYGEPVSFMTEQQAKDYAAEQIEKGFGSQIIPGTSNFVVFPGNEDMLTILKRNGGLLD
jgi:hypothetical protein